MARPSATVASGESSSLRPCGIGKRLAATKPRPPLIVARRLIMRESPAAAPRAGRLDAGQIHQAALTTIEQFGGMLDDGWRLAEQNSCLAWRAKATRR